MIEQAIEPMPVEAPIFVERALAQTPGAKYSAANSIREGEGVFVGKLGELGALALLPDASHVDTVDYDIISRGRKLEVKAKERGEGITPNHPLWSVMNASVADSNCRQACDAYLFASVCGRKGIPLEEPGGVTACWLVGWMPAEEFRQRAFFLRKGDIEPGTNFKVQADCWNMRHRDLRPVAALGIIGGRCPRCAGPYRSSEVAGAKLYLCLHGCTGAAIARALGEPLPKACRCAGACA